MALAYAGSIEIKLDGKTFNANGSFSFRPLTQKKEMIEDVNGVVGYKVMAQSSMIEGEVKVTPEVDVKEIYGKTASTVIMNLISGKIWVMNDAVFTEEGMTETEEGKTKVKFESPYDMREIS